MYFDFDGSAPSPLDTILAAQGNSDVPAQTILTLTNNNTDGWFYPRRQIENNVGAQVTGAYEPFFIPGSLLLSGSEGDVITNIVTAHLILEVP